MVPLTPIPVPGDGYWWKWKIVIDSKNLSFFSIPPGRGRVRARLEEFGEVIPIVSGLFNEVNDATAALIEAMVVSRVERVARTSGLQFKAKKEKGEVVGELRRQFSVASIRASIP